MKTITIITTIITGFLFLSFIYACIPMVIKSITFLIPIIMFTVLYAFCLVMMWTDTTK
ncbi:MAG: hypothetical protein ABI091_26970 [Ferruginibacter sp.]